MRREERFERDLVMAAESDIPGARIRFLEENAAGFFASPDVARYWSLVREWDISAAVTTLPALILGWLAFLCGDRIALRRMNEDLSFSHAEGELHEARSLRHALHALGLSQEASERLQQAEMAVAVLVESQAGSPSVIPAECKAGLDEAAEAHPIWNLRAMALANAKLTLAQVLAGVAQTRRAADLFGEAESLFVQADMPFPAAVACTNALLNHFRLGRYLQVLDRAREAMSEAAAFHGDVQRWWGITGLPAGMACCELLRPALAIRHLQEARACIDAMHLFHMHGLVEWYLFRAMWLQGDLEGMSTLLGASEALFSPMHHPFLDMMLSQFRLLLAEISGKPLPEADVEGFLMPGNLNGTTGMWIREETQAWLTMRGRAEAISQAHLHEMLVELRHAGNCPRLQFFLVMAAQRHMQNGDNDSAESCLREAVEIWRETGGAAGFAMYPLEAAGRDVAMLRVLAPELHAFLLAHLRERSQRVGRTTANADRGFAAKDLAEKALVEMNIVEKALAEDGAVEKELAERELSEKALADKGAAALLTAREKEILQLAAAGMNNAEIGKTLYLGVSTVKWHINNIFSKLGAANRVQAIRTAQRLKEIR